MKLQRDFAQLNPSLAILLSSFGHFVEGRFLPENKFYVTWFIDLFWDSQLLNDFLFLFGQCQGERVTWSLSRHSPESPADVWESPGQCIDGDNEEAVSQWRGLWRADGAKRQRQKADRQRVEVGIKNGLQRN